VRKIKNSKGISLLLCVLLLLGAGFSITGIFQHLEIRHKLQTEIMASEQIELNHIRSNLLQFATAQGYNSLTDPGRLPCPSQTPEGHPNVECLTENIGYLPRTSHSAINYVNQTVAHQRSRSLETSIWKYAVSKQVLQPNSLGWSQKVDWDQPPLTLKVGQRTIEGVVAVIAHAIVQKEGHLEVQPPYAFITESQIKKHLKVKLLQQVNATLSQLPTYSSITQAEPFIDLSGEKATARDTECTCRCTKTRCNCSCPEKAYWASESPCLKKTPACKPSSEWLNETSDPTLTSQLETLSPSTTVCRSDPDKPCVLKGPTRLLNEWGISFFRPVAALSRSCRPTHNATCPTSNMSSPCECYFGWPRSVDNKLSEIQLDFNNGRWRASW
jgi:hypothetical protein